MLTSLLRLRNQKYSPLHAVARIALSAVIGVTLLSAADLKGVNLGTHLNGPKIDAGSLQGKVVVFEYWGVNCPPCVANIGHVSSLASVAGPDTLAIIANHCQEPGRTMEVWKSKGGTDAVTVIEGGELSNAKVTGIPHIFVFDHTGKQVFEGGPAEVTATMLKELVAAAPGPLVQGGPYKLVAREAAALRTDGPPIAPVLKSLRKKAEGKDAAVAAEATTLLEGVQKYFEEQKTRLEVQRTSDPLAYVSTLSRLANLSKGDELGKPFAEMVSAAKADKPLQAEIAAASALESIKTGIEGIKGPPSEQARLKQMAVTALNTLVKRYPDTQAAKEAAKLALVVKE